MEMTGRSPSGHRDDLVHTSVSSLPDTVWVHPHLCWSAKDSKLHRHQRYQTSKKKKIQNRYQTVEIMNYPLLAQTDKHGQVLPSGDFDPLISQLTSPDS